MHDTRSARRRPASLPTATAAHAGRAWLLAACVCSGLSAAAPTIARAQTTAPAGASRQADEEAIRAAAREYERALERGDGRALAAFWTAEGDIVDDHGRVQNGRESVAATTAARDPATHAKVEIREKSLRFLSADVAVEDGTVSVTPPGAATSSSGWFTALWVKADGGWKLGGLRESRIESTADAPKLADLEWMVGEWTAVEEHPGRATGEPAQQGAAAAGRPTIDVSARWDVGRAFLLREMTITVPSAEAAGGERPTLRLMQRIGWDPLSRQIRSWSFSSDGGLGEGVWTRDGDAWIARITAVMPDGSQTASVNIYTADGPDRCTWRSVPTHVGGEQMPQTMITLMRKKGTQPR
jgi:uncharacterized protein (TIGR02246 family)